MSYQYDPFTVTETKNLNNQLTYIARAAVVDNLTGSWLYVVSGGRFIPPYTYGAVVPLSGTQSAQLQWVTPPGISPATVGTPLGQANAIFTDEPLASSNGQPVVVPTSQTVPLSVGSVTTPPVGRAAAPPGAAQLPLASAPNASGTYVMNLPAATETLMVIISQTGISTTTQTVTIKGVATGVQYASLTITNGNAPQYVPIVTGADTQVTVSIAYVSGAPNAGDYVELIAMPFPEVVTAVQQPGTNLGVNVTQEAGFALVQGGMPGTSQVSFPISQGADGQMQCTLFAANLGAGATTPIIAADFSLRAAYGFGFRFSSEGVTGNLPVISLRHGSAGTDIDQFFITGAGVVVVETNYYGFQFTPNGQAIHLANADNVAHTLRGHILFKQF